MAEKRNHNESFSLLEKDTLFNLIAEYRHIILSKRNDEHTNHAKYMAWIKLTHSFNETTKMSRSRDTLMEEWENLKLESVVYYEESRKNALKSGTGSHIIKIDPLLERVCILMDQENSDASNKHDLVMTYKDQVQVQNQCAKVKCVENNNPSAVQQRPGQIATGICNYCIAAGIQDAHQFAHPGAVRAMQRSGSDVAIAFQDPLAGHPSLERSLSMSDLCSSFKNMNKMKEEVEGLKCVLLQEKLASERIINELLIDSANLDILIKSKVLEHLTLQ